MTAALIQDLRHGLMADFSSDPRYPAQVYGFIDEPTQMFPKQPSTAYGFVWQGEAMAAVDDLPIRRIPEGHYFALPIDRFFSLRGRAKGFFVLRLDYYGLGQVGGPVEEAGRLKYIDGCSDTLLIAPPIKGDPCFNLLHFPKGIDQTAHTHPTIRAGLIHAGAGGCRTETGWEPLSPGKVFILYPDAIHAFETMNTDGMSLTVFHPDTDFGPTHEEHPMLNRTIVDGVSAKHLDAIRTKEIRA